jgi:uncharacterized lipoprotein YddW (UPF0748 family)
MTRSLAALVLAAGVGVPAEAQAEAAKPDGAAKPEVRGTWMTTTANTAIMNPAATAESMKRLREMGLNTVYVECWKNGYTEFPSSVAKKFSGVDLKVNASVRGTPAVQRDLLSETLIEAHRNQLNYIAWFEYGFMAAHQGTQNELRARRDWIVLNKAGSDVAKNGFVWMNPLHPDAQELLIGIVVEAVKKYDLDGIQLDDRIVWPSLEMGYDEYTRKIYREDTGKEVPDDYKDADFTAWRQAKVTEFSKRFVREVRAASPGIIISVSPGPYPWALDNYLCDWVNWAKWKDTPTWDEFIPQVYRMNYERFEQDWREQVKFVQESGRVDDLIAGIRLVGDGPDLPRGDPEKSARLVREIGGGGHVWWFSRGVLEVYADDITAFYDVKNNGQAAHPRLGAAWRPAPIVLEKGEKGWSPTADVPEGSYRVIAKFKTDGGEAWSELQRVKVGGRPVNSRPVIGVEGEPVAVELLVDRRGEKPAGLAR